MDSSGFSIVRSTCLVEISGLRHGRKLRLYKTQKEGAIGRSCRFQQGSYVLRKLGWDDHDVCIILGKLNGV
jgi:hypothetical protein